MVNLYALNKITISNIYPLPLPEIIMAFLIGKRFIIVVNMKLSFHQYGIYLNHRDRFIIISYRGLKYLIIALIEFRNNLGIFNGL